MFFCQINSFSFNKTKGEDFECKIFTSPAQYKY